MKKCLLAAAVILTVAASAMIQSCDSSTEPGSEILSKFSISLPDSVTIGETFTVTVTAVGSEGTSPFSSFNGYVVMTSSDGSVTPDSLLLSSGAGSGEIVLSGGSVSQTITATHGSINGSATVNAGFMSILEGDPEDSANEAIPPFEFIADENAYSDGHPELPGMYPSHNTIMIAFELGTTVGQANAVLATIDARIVGGITGEEGNSPGTLFLKLPIATHSEMDDVIENLNSDPVVNTAVRDILVGPNEIPGPNDGDPSTWTWENTSGGANWGLERIRVPQMWNFNDAVEKKMTVGQWPPSTALIIDNGFDYAHPDMGNLFYCPFVTDPHGTHIAGIIGAGYDNGKGIDGICPYVLMFGRSIQLGGSTDPYQGRASAAQAIISGLYYGRVPFADVINMSIGYNWADATIDSDTDMIAQNIVIKNARVLVNTLNLSTLSIRSPLIVVSAGNDSGRGFGLQQARFNSPMCYAAIEMGIENILVVEGVMDSPGTANGDVTRYPSSSTGGHLSAPGSDVWGTTSESSIYRARDGTSYAAAVVSGVAAYLYVIEPYLTFTEVKNVLTANALSAGGGAAPRIDAWASVVDLDRVRGGDGFLRMMCDIDDGTADGNQRMEHGDAEILDEDADHDGGVGDGNIDMSDFRRFRDWFLLCQDAVNYDLDGVAGHPKKDVNGNHVVEGPAGENIYPRGDFNGDGILNETAVSFVPGVIGGEATDLEVFQAVFDDPDYDAWNLPELLYSADYQIDATWLLGTGATVYARLLALPDQDLVADHTFTPDEPVHVFTMPIHTPGFRVEVLADSEEFEHGDRDYSLGTGQDAIFMPRAFISIEPAATYLHVCDDPAAATAPISLEGLGIEPGDYICLDNEGYFAYTEDPNWVSYEYIAVFSSSSTLLGGSETYRVPGAIDAGEDIWTWATNNCNGENTDIPEDFQVAGDGVIIRVPAGARYLFMCGHDSKYNDNWAPGGRCGVQISIVHVPGEYR